MKIRLRNQKGALAVEFAILLPLMVIVIFGIIEFGFLLYNQAVLTNASREGARYGIVQRTPGDRPTEPDIRQVVNNYALPNLINIGGVLTDPVTSAPAAPCSGFGADLTVTVTFHYDFLVLPNFMDALVGGRELRAETVMKCE